MEDNPRWMELCKQASVEQNPAKLMELIDEINRLRLQNRKPGEAKKHGLWCDDVPIAVSEFLNRRPLLFVRYRTQ